MALPGGSDHASSIDGPSLHVVVTEIGPSQGPMPLMLRVQRGTTAAVKTADFTRVTALEEEQLLVPPRTKGANAAFSRPSATAP